MLERDWRNHNVMEKAAAAVSEFGTPEAIRASLIDASSDVLNGLISQVGTAWNQNHSAADSTWTRIAVLGSSEH